MWAWLSWMFEVWVIGMVVSLPFVKAITEMLHSEDPDVFTEPAWTSLLAVLFWPVVWVVLMFGLIFGKR